MTTLGATTPSADRHSYVYIWPGRMLIATPRLRNQMHRHLAASVLIGLEGPFVLGIRGLAPMRMRAAVVASDVEQQLDSLDQPMLVLHVDPDRPLHRALTPRLQHNAYCELAAAEFDGLWDALRQTLREPLSALSAQQLCSDIVARVRGDAPESRPLDRRIWRVAQRLRRELPEKIDVDALAAEAGLSRSRLMHLFKSELGTSIRRFALSLRLQQAARLWRDGISMTTLAHEAGFYDLSHLLQAGRAYVGELPSAFLSMISDAGQLHVYACDDGTAGG